MTDKLTNATNKKKDYVIISSSNIASHLDMIPDDFDLFHDNVKQLYNVDLTKNYDKKISKKVYNHFANKLGIKETTKPYLTRKEVIKNIEPLFYTGKKPLYQYSCKYLTFPIELCDEELKKEYEEFEQQEKLQSAPPPQKSKTLWDKFKSFFSSESNDGIFDKISLLKTFGMTFCEASKAKTTMGPYAPNIRTSSPNNAQKLGKFLQDPDKYIKTHSKQDTQGILKDCADKMSNVLPVSSKLLHLSVTPKDMTLGKHNGYKVLNRKQYMEKLNSIIKEWDIKDVYSKYNLTVAEEEAFFDCKTVVFDKNSPESEKISKDSGIKDSIIKWINLGKYSDMILTGSFDDNKDLKLAIHEYYLMGLSYTDNGNSYTVKGYIKDIYDFSDNNSGYSKYMGVTRELNHIGAIAQENGITEKYKIMIPFTVTIPKSEISTKSKK